MQEVHPRKSNGSFQQVQKVEGVPVNDLKVFAGSTSRGFTERICKFLGVEMGRSETITFSEGNTFVRIIESVREQKTFISFSPLPCGRTMNSSKFFSGSMLSSVQALNR